jgi:histidine triad (HIT) family protein
VQWNQRANPVARRDHDIGTSFAGQLPIDIGDLRGTRPHPDAQGGHQAGEVIVNVRASRISAARTLRTYTSWMQTGCPFCSYVAGSFDHALIAYQDDSTLVPSRQQRRRNRGHCLVATREHVGAIYTLDDAVAASLLLVVRSAAIATKQAFRADGISVRQNNEAAAGQDVFHFHVHVVPR